MWFDVICACVLYINDMDYYFATAFSFKLISATMIVIGSPLRLLVVVPLNVWVMLVGVKAVSMLNWLTPVPDVEGMKHYSLFMNLNYQKAIVKTCSHYTGLVSFEKERPFLFYFSVGSIIQRLLRNSLT